MWFLKSSRDAIYYLLPGEHTIGRKQCDLILENDQSISRKHCHIKVQHPPENWSKVDHSPTVELTDCGSKYGTVLHRENIDPLKLAKDVKINLKSNDIIHFGQQWNKWRLILEPTVVVMSGLSRQEKESVKKIIVQLGGHVVNEWHPDVSHLTMSNITMTAKAVTALACGKPIVTPQFWVQYKIAIEEGVSLPIYENYIPPLMETSINKNEVSFKIDIRRRTLFEGKMFYFFSPQQFKEHGNLVTAAGGSVKLLKFGEIKKDSLILPNIIIMQYLHGLTSQSSQLPEEFIALSNFLKLHGKRTVPSSEIGLGILHCSVEKFCNPDFNFSSLLLRYSEAPTQDVTDKVLVKETQEMEEISGVLADKRIIIPDSGVDSSECSSTLKAFQKSSELHKTTQKTSELHEASQKTPELDFKEESTEKIIPKATNNSSIDLYSTSNSSACVQKRFRSIDDSDSDENPPRKKSVQSKGNIYKKYTHKSKRKDEEDSDDPDNLFSDFKESQSKEMTKSESDAHVTKRVKKNTSLLYSEEVIEKPTAKSIVVATQDNLSSNSPLKRKIPAEDCSLLPNKRFAEMTILETEEATDMDIEKKEVFISPLDIKKEDECLSERTSFNVSVIFKPLIKANQSNSTSLRSNPACSSSASGANGNNFKRFKKVQPLTNTLVPRIIGGQDLVAYGDMVINGFQESTHQASDDDDNDDAPGNLWKAVTKRQTKISRGRRL